MRARRKKNINEQSIWNQPNTLMFSYMLAHTSIIIIIVNMYFIYNPLDNNNTNATIVAKTDIDIIIKAVAEATTLRDSVSIVKTFKSFSSHVRFDTNKR